MDKILRKVAAWKKQAKVHAVIADWTGATLCGIYVGLNWVECEEPVSCQRCLKLLNFRGIKEG